MGWQDELRRRIEALTDGDWDRELSLHAGGPEGTTGLIAECVGLIIPCGRAFVIRRHALIVEACYRVNDRELAGRPRGTIVLLGASWDESAAQLNIGVRRAVPWNQVIARGVSGPEPLDIPEGRLPYPYFDFGRLAETWLDREPLF